MERNHTVYRVVWSPTRHFYVGVTKDFTVRQRHHKSNFRRGKSKQALQTLYNANSDLNNVVFEIVADGLGKDEAYALEETLIQKHLHNPRMVNECIGRKHSADRREASKRFRHTDETRARLSEALKGKNIGRTASAETRQKMSAAHKGRSYNKGRITPANVRKKLQDSPSNKEVTNGKQVWKSMSEAARSLKVDRTTVMRWVRKGTNGFAEV